MALTRKSLKAMGLTDEQVDSIIEMHSETVDGLKADVQKYKGDAEKLPSIQKELDDLKAKGDDGWKDKHDKIKKQFDDYKADIEGKAAQAAKETAVKAYLESKNITEDNLDSDSSNNKNSSPRSKPACCQRETRWVMHSKSSNVRSILHGVQNW
jgi:hypothetical protein